MTSGSNLQVAALEDLVRRILAGAGLNGTQAGALARVIAAGERDACKSHGIYRIDGVLRTVKAGKVRPDAAPQAMPPDASPIVRVDARGGFSSPAFELGLPLLVERARTAGLAALVINDCVHFTALWPEVEAIAAQGLAGLAMCPTYATVAPFGGRSPLLGTNPLAFGWPRTGGHPFVFDFATSVVARGEIELKRRAGEPLPEGWALDAEGGPTVEPEAALAGAMLPFGGHKGSAVSVMIELLAGVMIGDLTSREALDRLGSTSLSPMHGELILAFSPSAFARGRPGDPLARAESLFDAILGQGARLPSQRRLAARERAESHGIALTEAEHEHLNRLLELGLEAV